MYRTGFFKQPFFFLLFFIWLLVPGYILFLAWKCSRRTLHFYFQMGIPHFLGAHLLYSFPFFVDFLVKRRVRQVGRHGMDSGIREVGKLGDCRMKNEE